MKNILKNCVHKQWITKEFSAKRRRAIATVVSTVIILAAVSIMGVVLVGWANTNLYTKQIELESSFNDKMNKLNEDLLVENIWFGTNPSFVNITMTNVGSIGFNVTKIQIQNSTDTLFFYYSNGGVPAGEDYSIQENYYWNAGETVDFIVTTNRGNLFTAQEVT